MADRSPFAVMQAEQTQDRPTRLHLYRRLAKELGRPVVALFTSYRYPVMLEDEDANMLEGVLQEVDTTNGLCLIISSPGGSGIAAERIINMCRAYSGTGEYWSFVPSRAKSAATMVCMGASKIVMGPSSELGPIDPQWGPSDNGVWFSLANVVRSYDALFGKAVETNGNIQPFLQQLNNYDEREITEFRAAVLLADDIAVRALQAGMLAGSKEADIRKRIDVFCSPERTMTHGRPIYHNEAAACGLNVELADVKSGLWKAAYELQIRLDNLVSTSASKVIEYSGDTYYAGSPLPMPNE
jgi:hypothetical protein